MSKSLRAPYNRTLDISRGEIKRFVNKLLKIEKPGKPEKL